MNYSIKKSLVKLLAIFISCKKLFMYSLFSGSLINSDILRDES